MQLLRIQVSCNPGDLCGSASTHDPYTDLIIGSTSSLRETFIDASEPVALYRPQLSLSLPARISHVAFTADESHLVLGSASGGLAVYSVSDLNNKSTGAQPLFQLGTNNVGLREVKPNPAIPEFVAIVTTNGDVQMLNLGTGGWEQGSNGLVLKSGASTVSWSQRGKQIVCGMGDGTIWQMTPQGEGKAALPSVPGLDNYFVSSIVWLENHLFVTTHTPVPSDPQNNESIFHILVRASNNSSFQYTRLPDPVPPFGMDARSPPYFFHAIVKQYAPNMKDMIIFSNTVSSDIGLVSRFSTPISGEPPVPADVWCTTTIGDDTRRAQLPLNGESFQDTSPIGMALDLSSKDNVKRPVGGEEIEASPGPLPILMVLNHEGLLSAWHVVYNDAIERGEKYTGMMVYAQQDQSQQQPQQQVPRPLTPPRPSSFAGILGSPGQQTPSGGLGWGFGAMPGPTGSSFASLTDGGLASSRQLPTGSVFGTGSNLGGSAFGKPAFGTSSFGQPSAMGTSMPSAFSQTPSPWGATSSGPTSTAAAQTAGSAFGQTSTLGASFGTSTALGTSGPAFGAPTALGSAKSTSAFGQASSLGGTKTGGSVFGSGNALGVSSGLGASGFGAYANKGGFGATATATPASSAPIWATGNAIKTESTQSVFGTGRTPGAFGVGGTSGFKISSGFKADGTTVDDAKNPAAGDTFGTFGTGLGDALGTAQSTPRGIAHQGPRDADMDGDSDIEQDKPSDDEDDDIITPGARQGPVAPLKPATLPSAGAGASPFATSQSHFGQLGGGSQTPVSGTQQSVFSNWKSTTPSNKQGSPFSTPSTQPRDNPFSATPAKTDNNPFSATPSSNPFGTSPSLVAPYSPPSGQIVSAFGGISNKPSPKPSPVVFKEPSPDAAPLPPDFTKTKAKPADEVPDAPLPPDFTKDEVSDIPLPPDFTETPKKEDREVLAEEAPLPPDFTTPAKSEKSEESEIPGLPDDEEGEADDEEEYNEGYDEGSYSGGEEKEEEEDEEEDEDDEEEDEDDPLLRGVNITPPKGGLFTYDLKPQTPQSASPGGSSIFGSTASYKDTIGDSGLKKDAPFASLFGAKPVDHGKPSDPKKALSSAHTPPGRDKDKKSGSGIGGGMFSKATKKSGQTIGRTSSAPAQSPGGSFFPSPTPIPAPAASSSSMLFPSATSKPASAPASVFSGGNSPIKPPATASVFEKPSTFGPTNSFGPTNRGTSPSLFGSPVATKPARSSPLVTVPPQSPQQQKVEPQEEPKEEPKEESDLDLDNELSDREDEKIRRKLAKGNVKPLENLPKLKSIREVEVANVSFSYLMTLEK